MKMDVFSKFKTDISIFFYVNINCEVTESINKSVKKNSF